MRPAGFSTGAFSHYDRMVGVDAVRRHGLSAVELSAFSESELRGVEDDLRAGVAGLRLGLHGPVKARALEEVELVARLDALELSVVMHPYVFEDVRNWRPLGDRLLVENSDGRKATGQSPESLDRVFALVPEASMCLDVSHALHAGGAELLEELLDAYAPRIRQIHLGCDCGGPRGKGFEPELVEAVAHALTRTTDVVVMAERSIDPGDEATVTAQAEALHRLASL